ncbi:MAG TPA: GMC family oxidoreductase [Candidatus Eremiobacteraeota bacterium]|nr:MAG: 6'''-hydroxyparomomycin C oxidase [bacterium ADurb.Bin363]HPZ09104.1 GMC family oxidoreductase [Candidatus Eremiobacteraeota bacterium]
MDSKDYDVIIVGSGIGGSCAAFALSKVGFKTLVLERGIWIKGDEHDWDPKEILINKRYKGETPLLVKQYKDRDFKELYNNEVVGGMSVFYGGAVMRMREKDFLHWPIKYADMEPYYTKAEELLEVYGEMGNIPGEPQRSKPYPFEIVPLTPPAERIYKAADKLGYKPFRLPMTLNFGNTKRPLCIKCNTCDGFPCKIGAKNDASTTIKEYNLEVKSGVIVKKLIEEQGKIKSLECIDKTSKETFSLSSKLVILSAGTIDSAAILLRSSLEKYDNYPLTGKYLMRHCNAVVSYVFPFKTNPIQTYHKQVCTTHFYEYHRDKLNTSTGIIQDIYTPPSVVLRHFAPTGLKTAASIMVAYIQNLLCIAEDDPQLKNQVSLSDKSDVYGIAMTKVEHHYSKNDCLRRDYLIDKAKKILRKAGGLIPNVLYIDSFSHAVGTLRFGEEPKNSVLDKNCRFHGIKNLYVLDGSFMPTSSGVNPSLTIAANSLRVADYIVENEKL